MGVITLSGHSGCKIELIGDVVRKTSPSLDYNPRLRSQIEKQDEFENEIFSSPKILKKGFNTSGLFYSDMEFIPGRKASEFLTSATFSETQWLFEKIESFIVSNYSDNVSDCKQIIMDKCQQLPNFPLGSLENLDLNIETGYCHGDLTLENMIIHNSEIFLIDFLDSYLDSPIIDASKLLQDGFFGWSYRHDSMVPIHRMVELSDSHSSEIADIFTLINLYRIIPYSNETTNQIIRRWIKWLSQRINLH